MPLSLTSNLPEEILVQILEHVRRSAATDSSHANLAAATRTCKTWRRIGLPLLYQHSTLDVNYYLGPFFRDEQARNQIEHGVVPPSQFYDTARNVRCQPQTPLRFSPWIHSLSLQIRFVSKYRKKRILPLSLNNALVHLPNLRTLSLRTSSSMFGNTLERWRLHYLDLQIPLNITNFELDLQGHDSKIGSFSCRSLSRVLPQLHTLRLRLPSMCSDYLYDIFGVPLDASDVEMNNLKALSISLYNDSCRSIRNCCTRPHITGPYHPSTQFMDQLRTIISTKKTFPSLKNCALMHATDDCGIRHPHVREMSNSRLVCDKWNSQHMIWNRETYVVHLPGYSQSLYLRTNVGGDSSESLFNNVSHWRDVIALPGWTKAGQEMDEQLEGDAAWKFRWPGSRVPPNV